MPKDRRPVLQLFGPHATYLFVRLRLTLFLLHGCVFYAGLANAEVSTEAPSHRMPPTLRHELLPNDTPTQVLEVDLVKLRRATQVPLRAPTLPDLLHSSTEISLSHTLATVFTTANNKNLQRRTQLFQAEFELPAFERHVYLGASYNFALAESLLNGQNRFVSGQPLLFGRFAYAAPNDRYTLGLGLGFFFPMVHYDNLDSSAGVQPSVVDPKQLPTATTSSMVAIVRPWDFSAFLDRRVTGRIWVDARTHWRQFTLQFRQLFDIAIRTSGPSGFNALIGLFGSAGDSEVLWTSTLFLGYEPTQALSLGLEFWEVYFLKTSFPLADRDRIVTAVSPIVRFHFRNLEPSISMLAPIGKPLLGLAENYLALRFDLRIHL